MFLPVVTGLETSNYWHINLASVFLSITKIMHFWFSGDIILFPDEYNSILIRTEINVPEIPKMNADNK